MRHALEDGMPFSRWVPDLAFGYGYPFFNYRAAVSYYLGLGLYLTGLTLPQALNAVYGISIITAALGAFLLGRDIFGPAAGVVTAVAYVYAPYVFIDALVRGNMPESLALALLPYILWSFRRLLLTGKARYVLLGAATLALLWLTNNISSLLFTPFLALYVLVVWLARGRRDHLLKTAVALALGIGLTAFFWAPAVLEKEDVQLHMSRTTRNNDYHYNFVNLSEILTPPTSTDPALLNPPLRLPLGLGLASLALLGAALGVLRWRGGTGSTKTEMQHSMSKDASADAEERQRRERWVSAIFFALSGLVMVFMSTRASLLIWESLPLIPFVQFPWRFVGRAVLPFSLLAGAFVTAIFPGTYHAQSLTVAGRERSPTGNSQDSVPKTRHTQYGAGLAWLAALVAIALLILAVLPFTYPPTGYCPAKARPDMLDVFAYEHSTGLVGVDPEGSYFPVTVQRRPRGSPLEAQYAALRTDANSGNRPPVARFDRDSLPQGAVVHEGEYAPNRARLEIETPTAFRARYLAFVFPGWRVSVDGQQTDVIPSEPEGLITFDLPAGRHVVEIDWASTTVRDAASAVSLAALVGVIIVVFTAARANWIRRSQTPASVQADSSAGLSTPAPAETGTLTTPEHSQSLSWRAVALLGLLALLLLSFKLLVVDRGDTIFRRPGLSANGTLPDIDVPLDVPFADGVRFLGYQSSADSLPADGTLHAALYWSAYTRPNHDYRSTVALIDGDGQLWSPKTAFPRRGYADPPPSPAWGDGRYAVEGFDIEALPGAPPGDYDLLLTAFDRGTLAPLSVLNDAGQVAGPDLIIGTVELTRPSRFPDPTDMSVGTRLDASLGPLVLVGADLDRQEAAPGDPAMVTLFWHVPQSEQPAPSGDTLPDVSAHLALLDTTGAEAMAWDLPPVRADWPTSLWLPGDLWRGQHVLRLPGALQSGDYTWQLQLTDPQQPQSLLPDAKVELGALRINAPERQWQAPPLQLPLDADLGGQVTLLGANLEPVTASSGTLEPSDTLTVTLVWQGQAEMDTSYRVFLHLLGPDGSLLVQSDGEPADWTRPTTGWAPGEVVLDQRVLTVPDDAPPAQYTLIAGLYQASTGDRLALPDGSTAILVTPFIIQEP
jgi:hypothetical protein